MDLTKEQKRDVILGHIEIIWDECQERNIGSNEAELDFRESVTDYIVLILK